MAEAVLRVGSALVTSLLHGVDLSPKARAARKVAVDCEVAILYAGIQASDFENIVRA